MTRAVRLFPLALLLASLDGCTSLATGTVEVRLPPEGQVPAVAIASVSMVGAALLDVPRGALTSHASLVRLDSDRTCFDLVVRLFAEQTPTRKVAVAVDLVELASFESAVPVCASGAPCLPDDSALCGLDVETDARIRVEAERVCFEKLPVAGREVSLSVGSGIGTMHFRFRIHA